MRAAEAMEATQARRLETLLVEVDAASDLRRAYPNYFLDVGMFVERLRPIIERKPGARKFNLDAVWNWRGR
jgi:hypothetical protein